MFYDEFFSQQDDIDQIEENFEELSYDDGYISFVAVKTLEEYQERNIGYSDYSDY